VRVGRARVGRVCGVDASFKSTGEKFAGAGAFPDFSNSCWPGLSCVGRERTNIFNPRRTLVRTNIQRKSSYDIAVVCFHVYLSVFFAKYNITNE